jgi:hypothetical protein
MLGWHNGHGDGGLWGGSKGRILGGGRLMTSGDVRVLLSHYGFSSLWVLVFSS